MDFRKKWHQWFRLLEDLCFPPRCAVCDGLLAPEEKGIHEKCRKKLYPVTGALCMHCGRPVSRPETEYCADCSAKRDPKFGFSDTFVQGKALYLYQGDIKKSMYRFKYSNKREYAWYFAKEAVLCYETWFRQCGIEAVVPVPMYRKKKRKRGYNQAEVFARELAVLLDVPVCANAVQRIRDTVPQKELNQKERKNNLKNAFHISKNIVKYSRILLIDDIYTTGSTADELAAEFHKHGINHIYFMSICIGAGH